MKPWTQRPIEIRNLFNPAFCGLVIFRAITGFEELEGRGMPYSLSLLILPLCLHKESREIIIDSPRSYFLKTAERNQQIMVGFADRATRMIPYAMEGFALLANKGCINVSGDGRLQSIEKKVRKSMSGTTETVACQRAAKTLGREFARIADRATIFTALGVRP